MPTTYAIPDGRTVMAATLYTGTGATQVVSNAVNGVSMQPDLVWLKIRSGAANHVLIDAVRGYDKYLGSNTTAAEATSTDQFTSFNSNGFTLGANSGAGGNTNQNGSTYVGWQWNAGGSTVTNTNGSISAQVRANATAGFSIVTYTGNGTSGATVGHGLGVALSMIIVKQRSGVANWPVYHKNMSATPTTGTVWLNVTNAFQTPAMWSSAPTSSVFSITADNDVNTNTSTYVAYCFAPVAGYSAFGSYTGNGSADGPFVYLGFRPRYILVKRTDTVGNWNDFDTSRNTYNGMNNLILLNSSAAETVGGVVLDSVSNGFKLRDTSGNWNASGGTYIYACFAENPFKYANAR